MKFRTLEPAGTAPLTGPAAGHDFDSLVSEGCAELLGSLRRADQRRRGEQYIRGLLTAQGRKTARNLAAFVGEGAAEQSLHHFVAGSTWDWGAVRAALARYVDDRLNPEAWVIWPMVVSKAGVRSVGVSRRFVPDLGRVVSCQQSHGLWLASGATAAPVSWHLTLGGGRGGDGGSRQLGAPGALGEEENVVRLVAEAAQASRTSARPVVMDARAAVLPRLVRGLSLVGLPFMVRVGGNLQLASAGGRGLVDHHTATTSAQQLMEQMKRLSRPVEWQGSLSLVAPHAVVLPGVVPRRTLVLMGVWRGNRRRPADLWLTDLTSWDRGALLRLAMLTEQVDADFERVSVGVGMRDFEGRSFQGWHRHVTLASIAHTLRLAQPSARVDFRGVAAV
ncbi:transposase [Streptomyces spiramyceticus]|uniref:TylR-like regulatory protein n=1 Tax=Streptomyces spiramyceticus TaxID=299717 RepID=A0A411PXG9_9ACTN|nr:transposase [Streptomyces spiramyceticus]QBG49795.1 TylR-like regulatory protein [Streptomyces spiramyceticus]